MHTLSPVFAYMTCVWVCTNVYEFTRTNFFFTTHRSLKPCELNGPWYSLPQMLRIVKQWFFAFHQIYWLTARRCLGIAESRCPAFGKTRFKFCRTALLRMRRRQFRGCGIFSMFVLIDATSAYPSPFYFLPVNFEYFYVSGIWYLRKYIGFSSSFFVFLE